MSHYIFISTKKKLERIFFQAISKYEIDSYNTYINICLATLYNKNINAMNNNSIPLEHTLEVNIKLL